MAQEYPKDCGAGDDMKVDGKVSINTTDQGAQLVVNAPGTVDLAEFQENGTKVAEITRSGRFKDIKGWISPVGMIVAYGGTSAPDGWLLCDGKAYDQASYPELYGAISSNYGDGTDGTGSTGV